MKIKARVGKNKIYFTSPLAEARFFEKFDGKDLLIEIDDKPTAEMRRYFEGCIVPVVFYSHPHSGWNDLREVREAIKGDFLPVKTVAGAKGKPVTVVQSTTDLSKRAFREFLDQVIHWLLENQIVSEGDIDPEIYKAWRDSAPAADEVYPPLARLKELYNEAHGAHGKSVVSGTRMEVGGEEDCSPSWAQRPSKPPHSYQDAEAERPQFQGRGEVEKDTG